MSSDRSPEEVMGDEFTFPCAIGDPDEALVLSVEHDGEAAWVQFYIEGESVGLYRHDVGKLCDILGEYYNAMPEAPTPDPEDSGLQDEVDELRRKLERAQESLRDVALELRQEKRKNQLEF